MSKFVDYTGKKFNKLTVIRELGYGQVLCRCDCGNIKEINKGAVINGRTKSCGCLRITKKEQDLFLLFFLLLYFLVVLY